VIKQKQPLKILPSQEQAENTEAKYWHRWESFWIRIASRKRTDFIYCWRQHLGGRVENAITTFKPEIIVTNSGGAIIPGFENNPILMNEEQTILLADCKERKSYRRSFGKFRPL
jgi:hypothetical protein